MIERIAWLWPEIILFLATCVVMVLGVSPRLALRRQCAFVSGLALFLAAMVAIATGPMATSPWPQMVPFMKGTAGFVGLLTLLVLAGTVDREVDRDQELGRGFAALRANRAEFYAFFLFSMTGLMLCASADDLIWLFLALELTSLPTYVMVTISTRRSRSQEAGVKYFFLGALGAAIFLYGFSLLYMGTGSTDLGAISTQILAQAEGGAINDIAMAGLVLSLIGVSFKIAAVPMHFYTADVYQGAAASVSAMLAFVPKAAGFIAILLLVSTVGWQWGVADTAGVSLGAGHSLPEPVRLLLWVMAVFTMTVGNVLALLQRSIKRILAYSSIAHSGYMLVGVIAGPQGARFIDNGVAATLFYLLSYGLMNVGAFAVVASMEHKGEEADDLDALRGLCRTRPWLGWTMVICALSLLGFPFTLGFFAKVPLFTSGIAAGEYALVVILGINSAIAAFYYLRLAALPMLEEPVGEAPALTRVPARIVAGVLSAGAVLGMVLVAGFFMERAARAAVPGLFDGTHASQSATDQIARSGDEHSDE